MRQRPLVRARTLPRPAPLYLVWLAVAALMLLFAAGCQTANENAANTGVADEASNVADNESSDDAGSDDGAALGEIPDYMVKGDPDAPVTMFEYSDFQ